ncbi:MAG: Fic family protein [Verrucomicrobiales bacterium]|nr:Fic family protein [Verrucomicrobiales bacterium]
MKWNWQQAGWGEFSYRDKNLTPLEREFLHQTGLIFGAYRHLSSHERDKLRVELISDEALKTSEIEGEYLNRESLQSSIRKHLGLDTDHRRIPPGEAGIAEFMIHLFSRFDDPLDHETLFHWHKLLMNGRHDLQEIGAYRSDPSPMQIVSGQLHEPKVHFEAPPSDRVTAEMDQFIAWFNESAVQQLPALTRAGITHSYFESIHPFEDGNGRIGRALSEKALAQSLGQPSLIPLAAEIHRERKRYYGALAAVSKDNEITDWLEYFAQTVLDAVHATHRQVGFLIEKSKLFQRLDGQLNSRQEKCLLRLFEAGPKGFEGGLSAKNYISITQAHRVTATRDLNDLVEKGALTKVGERKSTRYFLYFQAT